MSETSEPRPPKKASSVRHTRAIQRDRSKRPNTALPDEQIADRLREIVHPATLTQVAHYHRLGLRQRTLTLPVMVALVLSMVWRHIGSVTELTKMMMTKGLLWATARKVSQQALSERLRTFPSVLFLRVFLDILPQMETR